MEDEIREFKYGRMGDGFQGPSSAWEKRTEESISTADESSIPEFAHKENLDPDLPRVVARVAD